MKKTLLQISIVSVVILLISFIIDLQVVMLVSLMSNNIFNNFFFLVTYASSKIVIFVFLSGLFLFSKNKKKSILPLWLTLFLTGGTAFLLKNLIGRGRPFNSVANLLSEFVQSHPDIMPTSFAFPSFHTMLVFCAIPIISKNFPKLKYYWIGFSILVAFSRIYFGFHYLSDVIAGALIGYLIGVLVLKKTKKKKK